MSDPFIWSPILVNTDKGEAWVQVLGLLLGTQCFSRDLLWNSEGQPILGKGTRLGQLLADSYDEQFLELRYVQVEYVSDCH